MVVCRHCRWPETRVVDSRSTDETVKRRRRCTDCGYAWNTYEVTEGEYDALAVVLEMSQAAPLTPANIDSLPEHPHAG